MTTLVAVILPLLVTVKINLNNSVTFTFSVRLVVFTIVKLTAFTSISVEFDTSVLFSAQVTFTTLVFNPVPLVRTIT